MPDNSQPWMISVDDHIIEPPNVWVDRMPEKYKDRCPRFATDDEGEAWFFEGRRQPLSAGNVNGAIWPPEDRFDYGAKLRFADLPAGTYDAKARVEAMNTHSVIAAVVFANYPGFTGNLFSQTEDKDLALICIQAYNDWFLEEWCDAFPGRFIGQIIIPMWDPKLAAAEVERTAAKGARSVGFHANVPSIGDPPTSDLAWDPFFAAIDGTGMVINSHGGQGNMGRTEMRNLKPYVFALIDEARAAGEELDLDMDKVNEALDSGNVGQIMATPGLSTLLMKQASQTTRSNTAAVLSPSAFHLRGWLASDVFERFPNITHVMSENHIGWIPGVLSSMPDSGAATERFRGHMYAAWIPSPEDGVGVQEWADRETLEGIGIDNVLAQTDYPHTATLWPHSMDKALETFAKAALSDDEAHKILRGNAERVFKFTPAEPPVPVG